MFNFISLLYLFTGAFVAGESFHKVLHLHGRIVGGSPAKIDEFPYQVSVQTNGIHVCGGSIINEKYVLTAAQCVQGSVAGYTIRAGSSNHEYGGSVHVVFSIAFHANYGEETNYNNDVALIRIVDTFQFGTNVRPVQLTPAGFVPHEGDMSVVAGWGYLEESQKESAPSHLQAVEVHIVNIHQCNSSYSGLVYDTMLCAGYTHGGRDACQGDSGGALVIDGVQVGIVSWGFGCARRKYPGVYASVGYFRTWINANIAF